MSDEITDLGGDEQRIIDYVADLSCLTLTEKCLVSVLELDVDVVNSRNAENVISELVDLVKFAKPAGECFSKLTVRKKSGNLIRFYVTYNKKVVFLAKNKERITKDIATYLIKTLN